TWGDKSAIMRGVCGSKLGLVSSPIIAKGLSHACGATDGNAAPQVAVTPPLAPCRLLAISMYSASGFCKNDSALGTAAPAAVATEATRAPSWLVAPASCLAPRFHWGPAIMPFPAGPLGRCPCPCS
ncbi:hypothetical protein Vafri_9841, partial [Volvox africanus]